MQEYCLKTIYVNLSSIIVNSWVVFGADATLRLGIAR